MVCPRKSDVPHNQRALENITQPQQSEILWPSHGEERTKVKNLVQILVSTTFIKREGPTFVFQCVKDHSNLFLPLSYLRFSTRGGGGKHKTTPNQNHPSF